MENILSLYYSNKVTTSRADLEPVKKNGSGSLVQKSPCNSGFLVKYCKIQIKKKYYVTRRRLYDRVRAVFLYYILDN